MALLSGLLRGEGCASRTSHSMKDAHRKSIRVSFDIKPDEGVGGAIAPVSCRDWTTP